MDERKPANAADMDVLAFGLASRNHLFVFRSWESDRVFAHIDKPSMQAFFGVSYARWVRMSDEVALLHGERLERLLERNGVHLQFVDPRCSAQTIAITDDLLRMWSAAPEPSATPTVARLVVVEEPPAPDDHLSARLRH